jgi:hypothetical protein
MLFEIYDFMFHPRMILFFINISACLLVNGAGDTRSLHPFPGIVPEFQMTSFLPLQGASTTLGYRWLVQRHRHFDDELPHRVGRVEVLQWSLVESW